MAVNGGKLVVRSTGIRQIQRMQRITGFDLAAFLRRKKPQMEGISVRIQRDLFSLVSLAETKSHGPLTETEAVFGPTPKSRLRLRWLGGGLNHDV